MKRQCGDCTKCCEGNLSGEAKGKRFYGGKPCHFVAIGEGCSIYEDRPEDPCINYKCSWLADENFPEWFKPSKINAIIDVRKIDGISYISVLEAGETLRADVLSWLVVFAMNNGLNLCWNIKNGGHWFGNPDFLEAMAKRQQTKL